MSVSKLCGPSARVPAGQKWVESGSLGDWLSARLRRIILVRCSLAFAAMYAMAKAARFEGF